MNVSDILYIVVFAVVWFVLVRFILPRAGVPT